MPIFQQGRPTPDKGGGGNTSRKALTTQPQAVSVGRKIEASLRNTEEQRNRKKEVGKGEIVTAGNLEYTRA